METNKYRINITKSIFSIILGIALVCWFIFLSVTIVNTTRQVLSIIDTNIDHIHSTISTINDGLESVSESFDTMNSSLQTVKSYVVGIEPVLDNISRFIGTDLTNLAESGRDSLVAAAQGSIIIDDTLTFLSKIPFLNFSYEPKQTLNKSLMDLSETFGNIPNSFSGFRNSLNSSTNNLGNLEQDFEDFSVNLDDMKENIKDTRLSLQEFSDEMDGYQSDLPQTQQKIITWTGVSTGIICFIIVIWIISNLYVIIASHNALKSDKIAMRTRREG